MDKLCEWEVQWVLDNLNNYRNQLHAASVIISIQRRYLNKMRSKIDDYIDIISKQTEGSV